MKAISVIMIFVLFALFATLAGYILMPFMFSLADKMNTQANNSIPVKDPGLMDEKDTTGLLEAFPALATLAGALLLISENRNKKRRDKHAKVYI